MTTWKWMGVLAMGLLAAQLGCTSQEAQKPAPHIAAVAAPAPSAQPSTRPVAALKTVKDLRSYSIGVDTARNFKKLGLDIDVDVMLQGMKDVAAGNKLLATDDMIRNSMLEVSGMTRVKINELRLNQGEVNKKEGQEFLAANKQREGVVTLESGLQYKILKAGHGPIPTKDETVTVKYKGTLIDGTVFDSTDMAGQAAVLQVSDGHIIAGFREAMRLMPVGSKWQLFVPARLGYLDRGRGSAVGPNATLIYEVELLGIVNGSNPAVEESPKNPSTQASPKTN